MRTSTAREKSESEVGEMELGGKSFVLYNLNLTPTQPAEIFRVASLSKGLGVQTSDLASNARHPRHLPTPIITRPQDMSPNVLDPRPARKLPPIEETFTQPKRNDDRAECSKDGKKKFVPKIIFSPSLQELSPAKGLAVSFEDAMQSAIDMTNQEIRKNIESGKVQNLDPADFPVRGEQHVDDYEDQGTNPYEDRADEIGPSHGIRGVGHLGECLTPLGWKIGDEPIPPSVVNRLHRDAREAAKRRLQNSVGELDKLQGQAWRIANEARSCEWSNQQKLDSLIQDERLKIYRAYQDRLKAEQTIQTQRSLRDHTPARGLQQSSLVNHTESRLLHNFVPPSSLNRIREGYTTQSGKHSVI